MCGFFCLFFCPSLLLTWPPVCLAVWLRGKSLKEETVRTMTLTQLDTLLCSFYREVRKRDGRPLKEHALRRVRSGLMKYLSMQFKMRTHVLLQDMLESNKVYTEMLSKQPSKSTEMLSQADCTFLRGHKALGADNPLSLLRKVWFELQLHFGARRWSPREMWPEVFVFVSDEEDKEYVILDSDQIANSHLKSDIKGMLVRRRMEATGGPLCPVGALKLYLSKRALVPEKPSEKVPFLQKPNLLWTPGSQRVWYTAVEISLSKNHCFIRELCEEVGLDKVYTNMSLCLADSRQYADCWP